MSLSTFDAVLHRIRVKLYPNYLPGISGAYIARTDDEAVLTIEQICAAMTERGGATASREELAEHIRQFMKEVVYQFNDGFAVNLGYFKLSPAVGGTFERVGESYEYADGSAADNPPVGVTLSILTPFRDALRRVKVLIEGVADVAGYIDQVLDVSTGAVNETLTPGGVFTLRGSRLRVMGPDPSVGMYFVPVSGGAPVQLPGALAKNNPSELIGLIPPLSDGEWRIRLVSQYTAGGVPLKAPRTIESAKTLSVGMTAV